MTVKEFKEKMNEFLLYLEVEKNLSDHTLRAYASDLEQVCEFWERIQKAEKITLPIKRVIERFLVSMYYKKLNKSSIARKLSSLQSFEKYLLTQGIELSLKLVRPRIDKKLPVYLSVDEITYLLDTVTDDKLPSKKPHRDKAILELLYATGIRCSELVQIKLNMLNLDQKTIRIFGKGRKERIVLFGKKAKQRIKKYLALERPHPHNDTETLFLNNRNEPLTSRTVQRIVRRFGTLLKSNKHITPHKLRHSFATHLLNQGVDLRVVQELLGHKTIASTEIYTHISLSKLSEMCDTIHPINNTVKTGK